MASFLLRNVNEIRVGGLKILFNKIKQLVIYLLLIMPSLIIIFVVKILRPWVHIRFGPIRSDVLGASMQVSEYYLSSRDINPEKFVDFFYFESPPPNKQWEIMIRRQLKVNQLFRYIDRINSFIPGGMRHNVNMTGYNTGYQRDLDGVYIKTKPHLSFSEIENKKGSEFLSKIGLSPEDKFICLIIRDPAYKTKFFPTLPENETTWRNSVTDSYIPATKYLLDKGYWVFRMGKLVEEKMKIEHKRFLDYACSDIKNDFLDIWLNSNCHFTISSGTGLDEVPKTFRKPVLHVNQFPAKMITGQKNILSIMKKFENVHTGEFLSLQQMIDMQLFDYSMDYQFNDSGIKIVDNSAEEIRTSLIEFECRLKDIWIESSLYKKLNKLYFEKLKQWVQYDRYHGQILGKISETFLLKNHEWLFQ